MVDHSCQIGDEKLMVVLGLDADNLLDQSVKSVEKCGDHRLRIYSEHAEHMYQNEFDFVVIALPHNQLVSALQTVGNLHC